MNRVKELREQRGMKQTELANKLNITQGTLSNWERAVHDPDQDSLLRLSEIFEVSLDYLLGKDNHMSKDSAAVTDEDIKFALFGDIDEDTDLMYEDVMRYAQFIKEKKKNRREGEESR